MKTRTRLRSSVIVVHDGQLLTVRLQDPTAGHIRSYLPGGMIEPDETPAQAAVRETKEETTYDIRIDEASARELVYDFHWDGRDVPCHTFFFRADLARYFPAPLKVDDASYHRGVVWMPLGDWSSAFAYHPQIQAEMAAMLDL